MRITCMATLSCAIDTCLIYCRAVYVDDIDLACDACMHAMLEHVFSGDIKELLLLSLRM